MAPDPASVSRDHSEDRSRTADGGVYLGIETSGQQTALALVTSNAVLASVSELTAARHNERIFDLLDQVFAQVPAAPAQLAGIGVAIGPGMFSALRVGLSVAKGLAMTHNIPLKGIGTLDALVMTAFKDQSAHTGQLPAATILPLIDAHKDEVYWALYRGRDRSGDFRLDAPERLAQTVPGEVVLFGSGVEPYRATLESVFGSRATMLNIDYPSAAVIADAARAAIETGNADDHVNLSPLYLRRTEAEVQREKRT
jgi:tRNA threonylcarbamoyladenosine biosynthesis protein TsaB